MDHKGIDYKIKRGCVKIELHPKSFMSNFWGAVQNADTTSFYIS